MIKLKLPYNGKVKLTSPYGHRLLNGEYQFHAGVDLVGLNSSLIIAPCDGIIESSTIIYDKSNKTWEWGNYVKIAKQGYEIFLCHMNERYVSVGQEVKQGEVLGREGNTGYAYGNHCHLEVRIDGAVIDPTHLLGIENVEGVYENINIGNEVHDWSEKEVEWCIKNGILRGDSAEKPNYRLNENITREEMCVMLYRLGNL